MIRSALLTVVFASLSCHAFAVDLESFEFNDANDTPLTQAVNTANLGNNWFYDEEATIPGDEDTGDVSAVESGTYKIVTDSSFAAGLDSRYLDIANTSAGTVYLSATFSGWNFSPFDTLNQTAEQVRFTFLDDDTGTSGSTVTSQMQVRRNTATGSMELFGDAIGTAGSFDIANTIDLPDTQSGPFTMVMALDKDSNSFEVFYKDGTSPSQSLGLGGVSRARDANSIRMVTNNFGVENEPPFIITETANLDRVAVSDTNPLTDLITLEIDRETGAMTLINTSGSTVSGITSVTVESAVDAIDLAELAAFSGTLSAGQTVALDGMPGTTAGPWIQNPIEDVAASLITSSGVRTLNVDFVQNSGLKWEIGDLDFDGSIDTDDYGILTLNAESDLSGLGVAGAYLLGDLDSDGDNDVGDFALFKTAFISANGAPAFARLVAGVPEPGAFCLTLLATLGVAARRRRPASPSLEPHTMTTTSPGRIALLSLLLLAGMTQSARAVFFEDFQFDDSAGTLFTGVANNANPGNLWNEDADTTDVATNGLGQLDASLKANTGFGTNFLDIEPAISTGKVFGVLEMTWDFQSVLDPTENEQIRLSFINANPISSSITAQYQITRNDDDQLEMNGSALGSGSGIATQTINGGSLTQTDKFIAVLAADFDTDTYEVLYSNDAGSSFNVLGSGMMDPARTLESIRLTLNNDLSGDNLLIDRFYLADELPITVDPDKLTLYVHPVSGHVAIVNESGTIFDIDYYRVGSGDGSLIDSGWNSLQTQATDAVDGPDAGSTPGDGIGETWTEAGGSDSGVLSESFLLGSSAIGTNDSLPLGGVFQLSGDTGQLEFEYRDAGNGSVFQGEVTVGELLAGDFNLDGRVDAIDYTVFRDNASGLFTPADYATWANNYGATLASSGTATTVPEPTTLAALIVAFGLMAARQQVTGGKR